MPRKDNSKATVPWKDVQRTLATVSIAQALIVSLPEEREENQEKKEEEGDKTEKEAQPDGEKDGGWGGRAARRKRENWSMHDAVQMLQCLQQTRPLLRSELRNCVPLFRVVVWEQGMTLSEKLASACV